MAIKDGCSSHCKKSCGCFFTFTAIVTVTSIATVTSIDENTLWPNRTDTVKSTAFNLARFKNLKIDESYKIWCQSARLSKYYNDIVKTVQRANLWTMELIPDNFFLSIVTGYQLVGLRNIILSGQLIEEYNQLVCGITILYVSSTVS